MSLYNTFCLSLSFCRFFQDSHRRQDPVLVCLCDVSVHDHLIQNHVCLVYIEHDLHHRT